jgi:hypothetical protein
MYTGVDPEGHVYAPVIVKFPFESVVTDRFSSEKDAVPYPFVPGANNWMVAPETGCRPPCTEPLNACPFTGIALISTEPQPVIATINPTDRIAIATAETHFETRPNPLLRIRRSPPYSSNNSQTTQ